MTVDQSDIGVLSGDTLSVNVDPDVIGADDGNLDTVEDDGHSFKTLSSRPGEDYVTLTLGEGFTRLRVDIGRHVDPVDVVFDGFQYFPTDYKGDDRGPLDANVGFDPGDGSEWWPSYVTDDHPARNMDVGTLIEGLEDGSIEPLPNRE